MNCLRKCKTICLLALGVVGLVFQNVAPAYLAAAETTDAEVSVMALDAVAYQTEKSDDIVTPKDLFPMGKWMLDHDLKPASWLGYKLDQKTVQEPINVIFEIKGPGSDSQAVASLTALLSKAGYEVRSGHSGGYFGYINGRFYPQIPSLKQHAFSNEPFEFANNHGRVFGPYGYAGKYWFLGAFSRERVDSITKLEHVYVSFNQARDSVVSQLCKSTACKRKAFVNLNNVYLNNDEYTTGDHDGIAVWVAVEE